MFQTFVCEQLEIANFTELYKRQHNFHFIPILYGIIVSVPDHCLSFYFAVKLMHKWYFHKWNDFVSIHKWVIPIIFSLLKKMKIPGKNTFWKVW